MEEKQNDMDSKIKEILEKIPVTERLSEFERAQMRRGFLRAISQESQRQIKTILFPAGRKVLWLSISAGIAACLIFLFLSLPHANHNYPDDPNAEPVHSYRYLYFSREGEDDFHHKNVDNNVESATSEIHGGTVEVDSATEFRVNRAPSDSLCGPRSLWLASSRVGTNLDLGKIIQNTSVGEKGCSLWDLRETAEGFGFSATGRHLDWNSLKNLESPAILHIRHNHFVCVDPREQIEDQIRFYDSPHPARWISQNELESIWEGSSLVLDPPPISFETGPQARFETSFHDFGTLYDEVSALTSFVFRNVGTDPLVIEGIDHSCGCITAETSKKQLLPGDEAEISVEIALLDADGSQVQMVDIRTNDPNQPTSTLVVQAYHQRSLIPSVDTIDFGVISPALPVSKRITIENYWPSRIPAIEFGPIDESSESNRPGITAMIISREATDLDGSHLTQSQSVEIYDINLQAQAFDLTPSGVYSGTLSFHTQSTESKEIQIPYRVTVQSDYLRTPEHVSFGVVHAGETKERSVVVRTRSERPLRVIGQDIEYESGECAVAAQRLENSDEPGSFLLSLSVPDTEAANARLAQGLLIVHPEGGSRVEIPWSAIVK